jgi:hypothetical protein
MRGTIAHRPSTNQPAIHQTAYHRVCMHVTVPETEVAGKQRPHPAVGGVTTQKFELSENRELYKKESH